MGTYIIATLLFLALAYALYKIFSKRGKCCGNCGCCGNDSDGCCGVAAEIAAAATITTTKNRIKSRPRLSHSEPANHFLRFAGSSATAPAAASLYPVTQSNRADMPPWPQLPAQ